VSQQLMGELLTETGDVAGAEEQFNAALTELNDYPAPLVGWKVHAGMARLKSRAGDANGAEEHAARALELVHAIAANVPDETLREKFLTGARAKISPAGPT